MPNTRRRSLPTAFSFFWASQTLSLAALQFGSITIPLLAINVMHASATQVAALSTVSTLPWLVFGLFAGASIDKLSSKTVIIGSHVIRMTLLIIVAVFASTNRLSYSAVLIAIFIIGSMSMMFEIARRALLPSILSSSELVEGNTRLAISDNLARVVGPAIAGRIVSLVTIPQALSIQSGLFGLAGLLLTVLTTPAKTSSELSKSNLRQEHKESWLAGVQEIRKLPALRSLTLCEAGYMMGFALFQSVIMLVYSREMELSPSSIGLIFSAGSVGGVASSLSIGILQDHVTRSMLLKMSAILRSVGLALSLGALLVPGAGVFIFMLSRFTSSFGWTIWQVAEETTVQQVIDPDRRGAINGAVLFVVRCSEFLGGLIGIFLAIQIAPTTIMTVGIALTIVALSPILSVTITETK